MKKLAALLFLVLASVALVACGSSNSSSSPTTTNEATSEANSGGGGESEGGEAGGGGSVVELEADPGGQLAYTTEEATAKAGKVSIDFKNPQPLGHDVAIEDSSGKTVGKTEVIENSATTASVNLKPGTYHFYCTIPGHREAGMEGTLVVE
jgi:plastocyanin